VLKGKEDNKRFLRNHLNLRESNAPLVACVSRLVPQKSPELIKHALRRTLERGAQFILLGTSPIVSIHSEFEALIEELRDNRDVAILMDKDEALAHQFYAAADLFMIPSLFEPCGLTQLIALRYGAVPIARMTGGLVDTVFDADSTHTQHNCYTFEKADAAGVDSALNRALDCYEKNPSGWHELMLNGMRQDFTWKRSAQEYLNLYRMISRTESY